ncbi:ferritin-like domain-containing protein [Sodalis sp. RH21]|uniref:YciE/YciF ferroxidase family protein n=1 Tax=unclassified Sodalis (in: enterobacteria) TaxID=2636512 RepID=UPI0039B55373
MNIKTLEDLFIHALSDVYSAEKQITRALPKMARAATDPQLIDSFKLHLEETHGQIERIDKLVEATPNVKIKRVKCLAMEGLVEEGQEIIDEVEKGPVRDAGLIAAAQKVEHYEIATYGTLATLAGLLGYSEAKTLLAETLQEEKNTDVKLSKLANVKVNASAGSK